MWSSPFKSCSQSVSDCGIGCYMQHLFSQSMHSSNWDTNSRALRCSCIYIYFNEIHKKKEAFIIANGGSFGDLKDLEQTNKLRFSIDTADSNSFRQPFPVLDTHPPTTSTAAAFNSYTMNNAFANVLLLNYMHCTRAAAGTSAEGDIIIEFDETILAPATNDKATSSSVQCMRFSLSVQVRTAAT